MTGIPSTYTSNFNPEFSRSYTGMLQLGAGYKKKKSKSKKGKKGKKGKTKKSEKCPCIKGCKECPVNRCRVTGNCICRGLCRRTLKKTKRSKRKRSKRRTLRGGKIYTKKLR